jgi:hypothetical protein
MARTCPDAFDRDGHGTNPEGQVTPILPKTQQMAQSGPEEIRVKPFKIIE